MGLISSFLFPRTTRWGRMLRQGGDEQSCRTRDIDTERVRSYFSICLDGPPYAIIHLAAQSSGAYSYRNPRLTFEVNVLGTLNLLEVACDVVPKARIVMVCSSDVYGKVDDDQIPIREETPFRPLNPYSASKAAQDLMGAQYCYSHGMNIGTGFYNAGWEFSPELPECTELTGGS